MFRESSFRVLGYILGGKNRETRYRKGVPHETNYSFSTLKGYLDVTFSTLRSYIKVTFLLF
jgi:hypothetical protein